MQHFSQNAVDPVVTRKLVKTAHQGVKNFLLSGMLLNPSYLLFELRVADLPPWWVAVGTASALVGIKDNLIRYSVGIEDSDDLIADLTAALERL